METKGPTHCSLAPFINLKPNNMALDWSQNGSCRHHFIHINLYSRRWSCFGSITSSKWRSLESQNGSNWSEKVLNVQMALMAPQKVPLVLSVYTYFLAMDAPVHWWLKFHFRCFISDTVSASCKMEPTGGTQQTGIFFRIVQHHARDAERHRYDGS